MRNNNPVADGLSGHFLTSCNPDDQPDLWGLIRSLAISHLQAIKLSGLIRYSPFPIKTSSFFLHIHDTSNIRINNSWNVVMTKIFAIFMTHIFAWAWKNSFGSYHQQDSWQRQLSVLDHNFISSTTIVITSWFFWIITSTLDQFNWLLTWLVHTKTHRILGTTGLWTRWTPGGGSGWASPITPKTLHLGRYVAAGRQGIKP